MREFGIRSGALECNNYVFCCCCCLKSYRLLHYIFFFALKVTDCCTCMHTPGFTFRSGENGCCIADSILLSEKQNFINVTYKQTYLQVYWTSCFERATQSVDCSLISPHRANKETIFCEYPRDHINDTNFVFSFTKMKSKPGHGVYFIGHTYALFALINLCWLPVADK